MERAQSSGNIIRKYINEIKILTQQALGFKMIRKPNFSGIKKEENASKYIYNPSLLETEHKI